MINLQPFNAFGGFGDGTNVKAQNSPYGTPLAGEYVHSQGMNKSPNGIMPFWNVVSVVDNGTLSDLTGPNFFAQAMPAGSNYVYQVDQSGNIFQNPNGSGSWALAYKPGVTTGGNGLIGDQKGRLLYPMTRYLGLYDGTADYTTGTIAVTNGSGAVVGTGTTFTAGMVDRRVVIGGVWYTIATFTDATHITLSSNYAGTTASGLSYAIKVGWNDKFQDFGASSLANNSDYRPADIYEDWVVLGNGSKVALLNVTDDSFAVDGLNLPTNLFVRTLKSGRTGILIGANVGNRCALILWDAFSIRSIAPWIWKNGKVQSIVTNNGEWIVITNREILSSNGYTASPFIPIPDNIANQQYLSVHPQGAEIMNDYLVVGNSVTLVSRMRSGYWILNLKRLLWEYAPVANGGTYSDPMGIGPIFFDSSSTTHVGYSTNKPSKKVLGYLGNSQPTRAYMITQPLGVGPNQKIAEGVKLNLGVSPFQTIAYPMTFDISVKIYKFKRTLWGYAQQKTVAVDHNKITVDGTVSGINTAQVGDEVTIMEGTNAGQVAHIIAIAGQDTSTEVWTLDTSFTGFTEADAFIQVMPFQLLRKYTFSNLTQIKELYFNCKDKIKGQKFLLKILFENIGNVPLELHEGVFVYDDLGVITTN